MPKKGNNALKQKARRLAECENIPYSEALASLTASPPKSQTVPPTGDSTLYLDVVRSMMAESMKPQILLRNAMAEAMRPQLDIKRMVAESMKPQILLRNAMAEAMRPQLDIKRMMAESMKPKIRLRESIIGSNLE
ncbi:hypothetical protein ACLQ2J_13375 [Streptomyces cyaneofuscatus]|uniref:hypothetical protein n=1 Tax=Streptomyces cyaneofuscatus TaxID=66883 RepID=UPI003CFA1471